jgi:hypothetical protein
MRLPNDGAAEITKLQTYEGVRKDSLFLGYIEGSDAPGRGHFPSYPEGGLGCPRPWILTKPLRVRFAVKLIR